MTRPVKVIRVRLVPARTQSILKATTLQQQITLNRIYCNTSNKGMGLCSQSVPVKRNLADPTLRSYQPNYEFGSEALLANGLGILSASKINENPFRNNCINIPKTWDH